jgi:hypothetical protein
MPVDWRRCGQPARRPAEDFVPTEELIRQQHVRPIGSVDDLPAEDPFGSDGPASTGTPMQLMSKRTRSGFSIAGAWAMPAPIDHTRTFGRRRP